MFEKIILDHAENVIIESKSFPIKNLHGYEGLRQGLFTCASSLRKMELQINQSAFQNKGETVMALYSFTMDEKECLVYNLCNWFSINFVSFFRLTTLLRLIQKNKWQISDIRKNRNLIKSETEKLIREIAPEVLLHRNKVAAHLAASDPFKDDSEGTLISSLVSNVGFSFPFYSVTIKVKPQGEGESGLPTWNLTQIYERLTPRFWPDLKIPSLMLSSVEELNKYKKKFDK